MNKYQKLGLYARHQILKELHDNGVRILIVGTDIEVGPERFKEPGLTPDCNASTFRAARQALQDRGVESDYSEISPSAEDDRKAGRTLDDPDVQADLEREERAFAQASFSEQEFHPDTEHKETRK